MLTAAADAANMGFEFLPEIDEFKKEFESGGVAACTGMLERKRGEWNTLPLNVAVIGSSGVGKSSFINAVRRLTADDEGAAEVDVAECTSDIRGYPHPNNPLLKFWDLPGAGTDKFPRQTYLDDIEVDRFDFFLLITATRFTENDTWLGNEFCKRNKKYFFVRTKIGIDISSNRKAHPRTHNEEAVVRKIRESTEKHLRENNSDGVPVFLIDSYKPMKFQFHQLEHHLIEEFPKMKKTALILSLRATSKEMIQHKVAELRSRMWKVAALSGAVATIPIPGVSLVYDLKLVNDEAEFYFVQLGLDEVSLKRHAKVASTDYEQLQAIVDEHLGVRAFSVEGVKTLIKLVCKGSAFVLTSTIAEEVSRFITIPVIGAFIAAPLSFGGTYYLLKLLLEKMEITALEVIQFAAERATDDEESDDF